MSSRDIDVGGSNSQKQQPCEILVGQKSKKDAASMICAIPISKPSPFHSSTERCVDSFLPGDWVEDATVDQNARFGSMLSSVNADLQSNGGVNNDFIIFQPVSHACSVDLTKKIPCFASENMSKNESSLDVSKCFSSRNNVHHFTQDGILGSDYGFKRNEKSAHIQQSWQVSKTQNEGPSSEEKKQKRTSNLSNFQQEVGSQKQHDIIEGGKALDEEKQRIDKVVTTTHGLIDKDSKDHSGHADNPKEDYVHIRVKRGQATNNHSLAERARRERISERMRFLQDLVPGCNKITGKAVMLDEIINYVQSLQRQVEFLSMKLATVNPELNFDVEGILSKDIHSINNVCESTFLKVVTGNNTCYANAYDSSNGFVQSETVMPDLHSSRVAPESTDPMFYSMSQTSRVWSDELQSIVQMGFTPTTVNNLDQQVCKRLRHDNSEIIHMQ